MSHWGKINAWNVIIIYILYNRGDGLRSIYRGILYFESELYSGFDKYLRKTILAIVPKFNIKQKWKILKRCEKRSEITNLNDPLNDKILSIIYGSLLGDAHAEHRKGGKGTRILFYQESSHLDYLLYLHSLITNLGYCNSKIPKIQTRLVNKGKIRHIIRFSTWTYTQFNIIHNEWYKKGEK